MSSRGWVRVTGQVRRPASLGGGLVIATDASVKGGAAGYGWIATDGRWGLGEYPLSRAQAGTNLVLVTELRAIAQALEKVDLASTVHLTVDCDDALRYLDHWAAGRDYLPRGYVGSRRRTPTLVVLAEEVRERGSALTWAHVRAHTGDPLNEAADSLAKIAREWRGRRLDRAAVQRRGAGLAEAFLSAYAAGLRG